MNCADVYINARAAISANNVTYIPVDEASCKGVKPNATFEKCRREECYESPECGWESKWSECMYNGTACYTRQHTYCNCSSGCDPALRPRDMAPQPCYNCSDTNNTCDWEFHDSGQCYGMQNDGNYTCAMMYWPHCPCEHCIGERPDDHYEPCPDTDCKGNETTCEWMVYPGKECTYWKEESDYCVKNNHVKCSCPDDRDCDPQRKPESSPEMCHKDKCRDKIAFALIDSGAPSKSRGIVVAATYGNDWAYICNDGFTDEHAGILCRRFGYKYGRVLSSFWFMRRRDERLHFGATDIECPVGTTSPDDCYWTPYENATVPCFPGDEVAISCGKRPFIFEINDIAFRLNRNKMRILIKSKVVLEKYGFPFVIGASEDSGVFASMRWENGDWSDMDQLFHKRRRDIYTNRMNIPKSEQRGPGCMFVVAVVQRRVTLRHVDDQCFYEYDRTQVMRELMQEMD